MVYILLCTVYYLVCVTSDSVLVTRQPEYKNKKDHRDPTRERQDNDRCHSRTDAERRYNDNNERRRRGDDERQPRHRAHEERNNVSDVKRMDNTMYM